MVERLPGGTKSHVDVGPSPDSAWGAASAIELAWQTCGLPGDTHPRPQAEASGGAAAMPPLPSQGPAGGGCPAVIS